MPGVTPQLAFIKVQPNSLQLQEVVKLWGRNRQWLGFFPQGAFDSHAETGSIVAVFEKDTLVGYVALRVTSGWMYIAHFCIHEERRKSGCGRLLMGWVLAEAKSTGLEGVRLSCRRDYEMKEFWGKNGFVPVRDKIGRGADGALLTIWQHSFNLPDLFSSMVVEEDRRTKAVIDANVFFDIFGDRPPDYQDSLVLKEPWMVAAIEICIVDEIQIEIDRSNDPQARKKHHSFASGLKTLHCTPADVDVCFGKLVKILGRSSSPREKSDRMHLAKTVASGVANVFLTRDGEILKWADKILEEFGLEIMSPGQLACSLDETLRASDYRKRRYGGTSLQERSLRAEDLPRYATAMLQQGEKPGTLQARLSEALAKIRSSSPAQVTCIEANDETPVALFEKITNERLIDIPLLRIAKSRDTVALARRILQSIILEESSRLECLSISDRYLPSDLHNTLVELGFRQIGSSWWRPLCSSVEKWPQVLTKAKELLGRLPGQKDDDKIVINPEELKAPRPELAARLETHFWPMKVLGAGIPTYVIPIQPTWAALLFDTDLAARDLFGMQMQLALCRENAFYRYAKGLKITAPARILWYVSHKKDEAGTMAIRACSRLTEVEIGAAKSLFKKYHRLGVYEWRNARDTAGGKIDGNIMVLRFADTELFPQPVSGKICRQLGIKNNFISPVRVDDVCFAEIYRQGHLKSNL